MSLETDLIAAITPICSRVYPDFAPHDTAPPYVTWQQVGGGVLNPLASSAVSTRGARIQVNVWSRTRLEANSLMNQIEDALRATPLHGRPTGALIARAEDMVDLRGAQQDFTFWR